MDQDSFRKLLQTPRPGGSSTLGSASGSRGIAVPPKKKTVDASQPAFKPRNVKKSQESKYRDRATERRAGGGNDYAHIEAVLEDFEKKHANEDREKVEEQRKYLGGDSEHSVLVKGLDFALLEQNKARSTLTNEDLDALDQAYHESSSTQKESTVPRKRTRAELLQELKDRRAGKTTNSSQLSVEQEAKALEEAKQKGKFKPIGFKPIGQPEGKKKLKSDSTDPEKKRKKKRKLDEETLSGNKATSTIDGADLMPPPSTILASKQEIQPKLLEEEPVDEEFDIFADAGEYKGIDVDEDDEDDENSRSRPPTDNKEKEHEEDSSSVPRRWIETDEHNQSTSAKPSIPLPSVLNSSKSVAATSSSARRSSPPHRPHREAIISDDDEMEDEDDKPVRLVPLASSALPSIKDFLAMDKAAGSYDKKKKRKDKKKNGGGDEADANDDDDASKKKTMEAKVDRDYKRLKTYTDKKAASGSK